MISSGLPHKEAATAIVKVALILIGLIVLVVCLCRRRKRSHGNKVENESLDLKTASTPKSSSPKKDISNKALEKIPLSKFLHAFSETESRFPVIRRSDELDLSDLEESSFIPSTAGPSSRFTLFTTRSPSTESFASDDITPFSLGQSSTSTALGSVNTSTSVLLPNLCSCPR